MKKKPLVSIITIFLNGERFIQEAIESVVSQTYQNWELLLVDDGSTDNSTQIAQQYVTKYPDKIRYLEHHLHRNRGKSTSRNLGISHAQGEYIAFLDADDVFLPLKLEKQIAILESYPEANMVYGNTLYWHSWTGNPEDSQKDYMPELGTQANTLVQAPFLLLFLLGDEGAAPCICSFLVTLKLVKEFGGFDESIQHLYEDQVFLAKIFTKMTVFVENECWEKYRQRNDSSWHLSISTGEDRKARLIFLIWLKKYLTAHKVRDEQVWQTLNRQLELDHYSLLSKLTKRTKFYVKQIKALVMFG